MATTQFKADTALFENFLNTLSQRLPNHAFLLESIQTAFEAVHTEPEPQRKGPGISSEQQVATISQDLVALRTAVMKMIRKGSDKAFYAGNVNFGPFLEIVSPRIATVTEAFFDKDTSATAKYEALVRFMREFGDCMASLSGETGKKIRHNVGLSDEMTKTLVSNPESGYKDVNDLYQKLNKEMGMLGRRTAMDDRDQAKIDAANAEKQAKADAEQHEKDVAKAKDEFLDMLRYDEPETVNTYEQLCTVIDNSVGGIAFLVPVNSNDEFIDTLAQEISNTTSLDINDAQEMDEKGLIFDRVNRTESRNVNIYRIMPLSDDMINVMTINKYLKPIIDIVSKLGEQFEGDGYVFHSHLDTNALGGAEQIIGQTKYYLPYTNIQRMINNAFPNKYLLKQLADENMSDATLSNIIVSLSKTLADIFNDMSPSKLQVMTEDGLHYALREKIPSGSLNAYGELYDSIIKAIIPEINSYAENVYMHRRNNNTGKDNAFTSAQQALASEARSSLSADLKDNTKKKPAQEKKPAEAPKPAPAAATPAVKQETLSDADILGF